MTEMYKVRHGGTPPGVNRSRKTGRRKFPVETMKVVDWFLVPHRTTRSVSAYVSRITKALPGKFITRAAWMIEQDGDWVEVPEGTTGAISGAQVWRTE